MKDRGEITPRPDGRICREELDQDQRERWELVMGLPINKLIVEGARELGREVALGGGTALVVAVGMEGLEENLRGEKIDPDRWGDCDWLIEGGVEELGEWLEGRIGGVGMRMGVVEGDYRRIDIFDSRGVEVASIGSLAESNRRIKKIREVAGENWEGGEWESYLRSAGLKNWNLIWVGEGGVERMYYGDSRAKLIEPNEEGVDRAEVYWRLEGEEVAGSIPRELAWWLGKLVLLPSYKRGFWVDWEKVAGWSRKQTEFLLSLGESEVVAARTCFAEKMARAIGTDLAFGVINLARSGTMGLISESLEKNLEKMEKADQRGRCWDWDRMSYLLNGVELMAEEGTAEVGVNEFLLLVGKGLRMMEEDFAKMVEEFEKNWYPRAEEGLAYWGGRRPMEGWVEREKLVVAWRVVEELSEKPKYGDYDFYREYARKMMVVYNQIK